MRVLYYFYLPIIGEIQIPIKMEKFVNKKILVMMTIASGGLVIQMIISAIFPASEFSFALGLGLAIFGILIAIEIILYSQVRKEISW